jgi:LuxR family transcriptional regulator, quorum-sensing system regulator SdiA
MASPDTRVATVERSLATISAICDRGFALAVHIRLTRPTLLYQTYADDWTDYYSTKGYMMSDPSVAWGLENTGSVLWSDLADHDPAGVIADAIRFGLTNGWAYSTGPASSRTISGTPKSGSDFTQAERDEIIRQIEAIHAATEGFESFPPEIQQALRALGGPR